MRTQVTTVAAWVVLLLLHGCTAQMNVDSSGDISQSWVNTAPATTQPLPISTPNVGNINPEPSTITSSATIIISGSAHPITTTTTTAPSNLSETPMPELSFLQRIMLIYIIVGVVLVLILVLVAILAGACILCERYVHKRRERARREKRKLAMEKAAAADKKEAVNKHEVTKVEETGSMTDFPLLCKVLENYDSTNHNARIKRYDSCDFEISAKTTATYLSSESPDCEMLDQLIDSLKLEAGQLPSKDSTPEHTSSSPNPAKAEQQNDEALDECGYHVVDIGALSQQKENKMKHSRSADEMFDDPRYSISSTTNQTVDGLGPVPEQTSTQQHDDEVYDPKSEEDKNGGISKSLSAADIGAFAKKQRKMYMSLQNVMDILDTKLPTDGSETANMGDLYAPRLVLPPNAVQRLH